MQRALDNSELSEKQERSVVGLSLACLEIGFVVKGAGAVILLFRLEYKTSVVYHNVNTQNVKLQGETGHRCETFENLHIDIAPVRRTLSQGFYTKNGFCQYWEPMTLSV